MWLLPWLYHRNTLVVSNLDHTFMLHLYKGISYAVEGVIEVLVGHENYRVINEIDHGKDHGKGDWLGEVLFHLAP